MDASRRIIRQYLKVISEAADEITDTYYDEVNAMVEDLKKKRPMLTNLDEMLVEIAVRGLGGYEKSFIELLARSNGNLDNDAELFVKLLEVFTSDWFNKKIEFSEFSSLLEMQMYLGVVVNYYQLNTLPMIGRDLFVINPVIVTKLAETDFLNHIEYNYNMLLSLAHVTDAGDIYYKYVMEFLKHNIIDKHKERHFCFRVRRVMQHNEEPILS